MNKSLCILAGLTAALLAASAVAQKYPERPVRVILGVPAGGTPDVLARTVIPRMSELLGQSLVVDNRGGAGGRIGADIAAHATPDGYTLFMTSPGALTIAPHLIKKLPYNALRDFTPISLIATGPFLLLVHPSVPAKSVKELIALDKAAPGKLNYASAGSGTPNHMAMELFKSMAGVNFTHVPYKGAPLAVTDLLAGRVSVTMNSIGPVLAHIKAGRLRALGIAGSKPSPALPDVPPITGSGVPGYESGSWMGLLAPTKTPPRILARLNAVAVKVVHSPETQARLVSLGAVPVGDSPKEFAARIRREHEQNGKVVKIAGVRIE
ncbi:MAG: tripartite tricarboxylate transporter substrate binding protein [Betaproteobacteria bacterium]|nr:tripartite tricarboxylate transporter substrate binding protein [Betaproteobacteria bacterium]